MQASEAKPAQEQVASVMASSLPRKQLNPVASVVSSKPSLQQRAPPHRNEYRLFLVLLVPLIALAVIPNFAFWINSRGYPEREIHQAIPLPPNLAACTFGASIFPNYATDTSLVYNQDDRSSSIIAMSRNGKTIALTSTEGTGLIRIYFSADTDTVPLQNHFDIQLDDQFKYNLLKLALSGDGTRLLVTGELKAALINIKDRSITMVPNPKSEHFAFIQNLAVNQDGSRFIITYAPMSREKSEPWNRTAVFQFSPQAAEEDESWAVHQIASSGTAPVHVAMSGDTLVVVSSEPSESTAGEVVLLNDLVIRILRDPFHPPTWQETFIQRILPDARLAVALAKNGTIVTVAVQAELSESESVRLALFVFVWSATLAEYEFHRAWKSGPLDSMNMPLTDMTISMSEDASLTILTARGLQPLVWTGDFWNNPKLGKQIEYTFTYTPSWAISEDSSTILLARPNDGQRGGGVCLLTRRQHP